MEKVFCYRFLILYTGLWVWLCASGVHAQGGAKVSSVPMPSKVVHVGFKELKKMVYEAPKPTEAVLACFWATWCKPCVKKLSFYDSLQHEFKGRGLRVLLISFDRPKDDKRVLSMLKARSVSIPSVLYDDKGTDMDDFVNYFDPEWGAEIPYMQGVKKGKRVAVFYSYDTSTNKEVRLKIAQLLKTRKKG